MIFLLYSQSKFAVNRPPREIGFIHEKYEILYYYIPDFLFFLSDSVRNIILNS